MKLHNETMNIAVDPQKAQLAWGDADNDCQTIYKLGHRDARHVAAELSLKADARIEELEEVLKGLLNEAHTATKPLHNHSEWSIKAQNVLEKSE